MISPPFNVIEQGEKLHFDIFRNLTRFTVYDIQGKVRCSPGLSVTKYLGGFGESEESLVELSCLDSDKSFGFILQQDATMKKGSLCYVQFAVLFTTPAGERKIRVFNYTLSVSDLIVHLYSNADCDAVLGLETKMEISSLRRVSNRSAREHLCRSLG